MVDETLSEESLAVEEQPELEVEETTDSLEAEDAGEEEVEDTEGEAEEKPKKKGGFQRRIERLEREKFEAEVRAEEAARQAREYQEYLERQQQPNVPMGQMPKLSDFDYDEDRYTQAMQQWNAMQLQTYAQQQAEQQRQQQLAYEQQQKMMSLQQKVAQATAKYPDFINAVNNPELPPLQRINPVAFEAVINSPAFDDIAYQLAKNPSKIYEFRNKRPDEVFRMITRMEIELEGKTQPVTKAPPAPPAKLSGKSASTKRVEDMTMEEYVEMRRRQQKAK